MTAVPRPVTRLTDEQQVLFEKAKKVAADAKKMSEDAEAKTQEAWEAIVEARAGGVPDELLCDETGFSRATLNRRFGKRPEPQK